MPFHAVTAEDVLAQLTDIEKAHRVKILFACESGSRRWGYASSTSDYDVRFLFVRQACDYLSVFPPKDTIEVPMDDTWDLSGWDLKKALSLMVKGNSSLWEWLTSPSVYHSSPGFAEAFTELYRQWVPPEKLAVAYRAMAANNVRAYLAGASVSGKKYLCALRPLIASHWIETHHAFPPSAMVPLLEWIAPAEPGMATEIRDLIRRRQSGDTITDIPRLPATDTYIAARLAASVIPVPSLKTDTETVNRFFCRAVLKTGVSLPPAAPQRT